MTRHPLSHWLLLFALVAMWGSSFLFTKLAVAALPPSTVVVARLVIAAIVLTTFLLLCGEGLPRSARQWRSFLAMAVVGNILPFWLITSGQRHIDSGVAGILMAVMPLTTLLLAHVFLDDERFTVSRGLGFALGFVGIVVLVGPGALSQVGDSGSVVLGELSVLAGAVCYAVNSILARRRPASAPKQAAAGVAIAASVIMLPTALAMAPSADAMPSLTSLPVSAVVAVLFLGVVATAIATVVYFELITRAGPSFLSLINYLIPIWAVVVGAAILGERLGWSAWIALVLVLSGIALSELGRDRARKGGAPEP